MNSIFIPFCAFVFLLGGSPTLASSDPSSRLHPTIEAMIRDAEQLTWGRGGRAAYAVLDLDETVIDSSPRRLRAYQIAVAKLCREESSPEARRQACQTLSHLSLQTIREQKNRYDHAELLRSLNVPSSHFTDAIEKAMIQEYLSGRHLELDVEIPGAVETVRGLLREGRATVYFVSSRYEDVQLAGTLDSLRRLGFLWEGDDIEVILRRRGEASLDFKRRAFDGIVRKMDSVYGVAVGVFENEPENLNAMKETFPMARPIFIEGAMLNPISIEGNATRLQDYYTEARPPLASFLKPTPLRSEVRVP